MIVLGIESSCDETAAAVVEGRPPHPVQRRVLADWTSIRPYGGVVPEIAAAQSLDQWTDRCHARMDRGRVDVCGSRRIAATGGPGLIGGVLVG